MAENHDLAHAMARLDALTDWERRPRNKMRVGLEPMRDLAARLGDPQRSFRSIHVAGTKGKGSVSALIEAALAHAGLRVGRYASPHVERITERVSVQGHDVDEPTLARALNWALDAYEAGRTAGTPAVDATWFDLLTAAAFIIFAETQREWAVIEVGLGGRLDSTNIVDGEIAVVTNIALEHTEILGHTRAAIAGEKVGILKPGAVLITTLDAADEAGRVVQARADQLGARVKRTRLDLSAPIEQINFALAAAVLGELRRKGVSGRSGEPVGAALLDGDTRLAARLPGRMERFDVEVGSKRLPVVMDGAHVPFNIGAVLRDLTLAPDLSGPCVAIVALAADKDAQGFVAELAKRASTIVFTDLPGSSRGRSPVELRALAELLGLVSEVEPERKASAQARARTGSPGQRLAPGHRLALSRRGAQKRGRRGGSDVRRNGRRAWLRPVARRRARLMAQEASLMTKARSALSTVFGFSDFRPGQEDVLAATFAREDVLAVMPTGSGKSLLFQLPAIVRGGLTLVVSPLIALMRDQVAQLREAGVEAASLNSSSDPDERRGIARGLDERSLRLLYIAPERLLRDDTIAALRKAKVDLSRHRRSALRLAMGPRFPP